MIELCNSKRTYLGKTADGRKRWALDASIGAIQFRENGGEWQDIDPSIEAIDTDGFSIKFTQVPYLGRIANDSKRRIYPDRTNLDCWIEFQKPFASMGLPTRQDRWFYWDFPNALMGVRFDNAGIKFGFRLKNSNAPTSITIPFTTQGITRQGRLLYHNGEVIAELRKPMAMDANEEERECEISFGASEVTINLDTTGLVFPIDIDPDIDLQVGHILDDIHETEDDGSVYDSSSYVNHYSAVASGDRKWGAHRWVSAGLPSKGDTIDVAYVQLYTYEGNYDSANGNLHFQKAASPARFTENDYDVTSRPRTTASVSWIVNDFGTGWQQTPSLKVPLQEVIDSYSPTAIVMVFRPNTDILRRLYSRAYNNNPAASAKLHIEWTAAGETHYGAATLSGVGTLATIGRGVFIGTATLAGTGTLAAIGSFLRYAKATLSGTGTLAAIGRGIFAGKVTLSGIGTLTAIGRGIFVGKAILAGVGTLAAKGIVGGIKYGVAALSGVGTLASKGVIIAIGKASLTGIGSLSAIGRRIFTAKATLSGIGTLTASAVTNLIGKATLAGIGTLSAKGIIVGIKYGIATFTGTGALSAIGQIVKKMRFGVSIPRSIPEFSRSNIQVAERHNIQEAKRHNTQESKR